MKIIWLVGLLALGSTAFADSFIHVINHSNFPVVAIWQAGGCAEITEDPEGDNQYTVCYATAIPAGGDYQQDFGMFDFDRSVKIWGVNNVRIGYCNSMDDETMTVTGTTTENQEASGC